MIATRAHDCDHVGMNTTELLRIISNIIRLGEVIELQPKPLAARVKVGDNETDWVLIAHARAGSTNDFDPPSIGEEVVLLCPSGELEQAIIIASLHSDANDQPAQSLAEFQRTFPDGTTINYNSESHALMLTAVGNVQITIEGDSTINVGGNAAITASGNATVDATTIALNGGAGVVTGDHICAFTGSPHSHCSSTVTAGA